jgi:catechol-2,3-dioxygenase
MKRLHWLSDISFYPVAAPAGLIIIRLFELMMAVRTFYIWQLGMNKMVERDIAIFFSMKNNYIFHIGTISGAYDYQCCRKY